MNNMAPALPLRRSSSAARRTTSLDAKSFVEPSALHVKHVLKPLALSAQLDLNGWPEFEVTNVTIVENRSGKVVNLFEAALRGPFTLTGTLDLKAGDTKHFKKPLPNTGGQVVIRVEDIALYSYGLREEAEETGHQIIWAGSNTFGWFPITPSKVYHDIYGDMMRSVSMFYYFQNLYKRKGAFELPLEQLFVRYAAREGSGIIVTELHETVRKNAFFFITEGNNDEDHFAKTPLFQWLVQTFSKTVQALNKVPNRIPIKLPTSLTPIAHPRPVVNISDPLPIERFIVKPSHKELNHKVAPIDTTPRSSVSGMSPAPKVDPTTTDADFEDQKDKYWLEGHHPTLPEPVTSIDTLVYVVELLHARGKTDKTTKSNLELGTAGIRIYTKWRIHNKAVAMELYRIHGRRVLERLGPSWKNSPLYTELSSQPGFKDPSLVGADRTTGDPADYQRAVQIVELNRREHLGPQRIAASKIIHGIKAPAVHQDRTTNPIIKRNRNGQQGTGSNQGTPSASSIPNDNTKAGILAREERMRETIESGDGVIIPSQARRAQFLRRSAGKNPGLKPVSTSSKRTRTSDTYPNIDNDTHPFKRAKSFQPSEERDTPAAELPSYDASSPQSYASDSSPTNDYYTHLESKAATPEWTVQSNTHNGTWHCHLCTYIISDPLAASANTEYQTHLQQHISEDPSENRRSSSRDYQPNNHISAPASPSSKAAGSKTTDLIRLLSEQTGHPVNHLLDRLQSNGSGAEALDDEDEIDEVINGRTVLRAIIRRF